MIAQSLHEAGFDKTVRLVTGGSRLTSLFQRVAGANNLQADLFISIHHDLVPDNLKETWHAHEPDGLYWEPQSVWSTGN